MDMSPAAPPLSSQISTLSRHQLETTLQSVHSELLTLSPNSSVVPDQVSLQRTPSKRNYSTAATASSAFSPSANLTSNLTSTASSHSWNTAFQTSLLSSSPTALSTTIADFAATASKYAVLLIAESHLPLTQRTYTPLLAAGGLAGGLKYLIHGILFKFALNVSGIYSSDAEACTAAGHEIKGMNALQCAVVSTDTSKYYKATRDELTPLHFPLQIVIDFLGHRLIATSLLPTSHDTLKAGISSPSQLALPHPLPSGLTDPPLLRTLTHASAALNLLPHHIGSHATLISHCADLEAHRGHDNRVYVLDTARVLPPAHATSSRTPASHLTQLLRVEFVRRWTAPLSADALSRFTVIGERQREMQGVVAATRYIQDRLIPALATSIDTYCAHQTPCRPTLDMTTSILEKIHRAGVNYRGLGRIRTHMTNDVARTALLVECVARIAKRDVKELLRTELPPDTLLGVSVIHERITNYLNKLLVSVEGSTYWNGVLEMRLVTKYDQLFCDEELAALRNDEEQDTLRGMLEPVMPVVYGRVKRMLNLEISPLADSDLKNPSFYTGNARTALTPHDLLSISPRTKIPTVGVVANAMVHVNAAKSCGPNSTRQWKNAATSLQQAIVQSTTDSGVLSAAADVYVVLAEITEDDDEAQHWVEKAVQRALEAIRMAKENFTWAERAKLSMAEGLHYQVLKRLDDVAVDTSSTDADIHAAYDPYGYLNNTGPAYDPSYDSMYADPSEPSYDQFYDEILENDDAQPPLPPPPTSSPPLPHPSIFLAPEHELTLDVASPTLHLVIALTLDSPVSIADAASTNREGVATALNTLGRACLLLSSKTPNPPLIDQSINCFSLASKLTGFDHSNDQHDKAPHRRTSHHAALNDRSHNALENAIAHANALLARATIATSASLASKKKDVESAQSLTNGVSSFLNLQSHVIFSVQNEHLMQQAERAFELAGKTKDMLTAPCLTQVGVRRSADIKNKGHAIILVGTSALSQNETRLFCLFDDGEVFTYKHHLKENMFTKTDTASILKSSSSTFRLSRDDVAFCGELSVIAVLSQDDTVTLIDCVSLQPLASEIAISCCSEGSAEPTLHCFCDAVEGDRDGFVGAVELSICAGLGSMFAVTKTLVRIATEGLQTYVLGMGEWSDVWESASGGGSMRVLGLDKINGDLSVVYCDGGGGVFVRLLNEQGGFALSKVDNDVLYLPVKVLIFSSHIAVLYKDESGIYKIAVESLVKGGDMWTPVRAREALSYAGFSSLIMTKKMFRKRDDWGLVTSWRDVKGQYRVEYKSYGRGDFGERVKVDLAGYRGEAGEEDLFCVMRGRGDCSEGTIFGFVNMEDEAKVVVGLEAGFIT